MCNAAAAYLKECLHREVPSTAQCDPAEAEGILALSCDEMQGRASAKADDANTAADNADLVGSYSGEVAEGPLNLNQGGPGINRLDLTLRQDGTYEFVSTYLRDLYPSEPAAYQGTHTARGAWTVGLTWYFFGQRVISFHNYPPSNPNAGDINYAGPGNLWVTDDGNLDDGIGDILAKQ